MGLRDKILSLLNDKESIEFVNNSDMFSETEKEEYLNNSVDKYVYELPERHSISYFSIRTNSKKLLDISKKEFDLLNRNSEIIKMHEEFEDFYKKRIIDITCHLCNNKSVSFYLKYLKNRNIRLTKKERRILIDVSNFVFDERTSTELDLLYDLNPKKYNYDLIDLNLILKYKKWNNKTEEENFFLSIDNPIFLMKYFHNNEMELFKKAIDKKANKTLKRLISNVNLYELGNISPLIYALHKNADTDILKLLILNIPSSEFNKLHGINQFNQYIEFNEIGGSTPLIFALNNNFKDEIIELLILRTTDLDKKDEDGYSALFYAIQNYDENIIQLFIEKGADINIRNNILQTPLFWANSSSKIEFLLLNGADVNIQDAGGATVLIESDDINIIKVLLKYNANVNLQDDEGYTAIMYASLYNYVDYAKLLIPQSDLTLRNNDGDTVLDLTTDNKIKRLLRIK